ncbi:MAG: putative transcriptional regulator [Salibacteraceae bacterium]|jgi:acetoin utilization protein AcuB
MLASEIVITEIPSLSKSDSVAQAIEWMDEFKVTQLAVIDNYKYLGLINENYLLNIEDPIERISEHCNYLEHVHAYENEHVFEIIKKVQEHQLSLIPVLSDKELFLGTITVFNLMEVIAEMPVVKNPGGIIVMDMNSIDYSLSEISRIVESNDAKILGCFISRAYDNKTIELTIKINKMNVQDVIQTFERFGYEITASYDQSGNDDDMEDRYNNLMNYLNM